jgi:O-antigen/teichoic acid export membrane protein
MDPRAPVKSSRFARLVGDSSLYVLGNVLRRAFSLITMPVFTRYLSPAGYGVLAIVGTLQNLLEALYEMGVGAAATRFFYDTKNKHTHQVLFGTLLLFSMAATLVLTVFLLGAGSWLWGLFDDEIPFYPLLALTVGTVFLGNIGILPRVLFRVLNQVPRFLRLSTVQTLLTVGLAVPFVVWLDLGPLGPVLATFIVTAIFFVVYAHALREHVRLTVQWPIVKRTLVFGLPTVPGQFSSWALKAADRVILQRLTSLSVVGIYSVGYAVAKAPFDLVANALNWAMVPVFFATATQESEAYSKAFFSKLATYHITALAALGLGTVLFGSELIVLLASSRYAEADVVVPLIVAAYFLNAAGSIPARGLHFTGQTLYLPLLAFIPAGVNIALDFILIPPFGIVGAAWAAVVGQGLSLALTIAVAQRAYTIPYDYPRLLKVILVAGLLAACRNLVPDSFMVIRLLLKALIVLSFPVCLWLAGVFDVAEVAWVRRRFSAMVTTWVRA